LEKVILTKQQAEALEKAKEYNYREVIVAQKVTEHINKSFLYGATIKEIPLDTLIRALYIGYEVEQTEQEKIQEIWDYNGNLFIGSPYQTGIKDTLRILGREDLIPTLKEEN
jgi:hypothetical protein